MAEMSDAPASHLQLALPPYHSLTCSAPHPIFFSGTRAARQRVSPKLIPNPRPVRTAEPFWVDSGESFDRRSNGHTLNFWWPVAYHLTKTPFMNHLHGQNTELCCKNSVERSWDFHHAEDVQEQRCASACLIVVQFPLQQPDRFHQVLPAHSLLMMPYKPYHRSVTSPPQQQRVTCPADQLIHEPMIFRQTLSKSHEISGNKITSAPPASPACKAIHPA